ncbi:MAG: family 78 glycoside hydrolase catalytic domain [Victivallales bacterium]|nr:family 78 glycoside hydrolase catalytic domain [Victivallales bacterium]
MRTTSTRLPERISGKWIWLSPKKDAFTQHVRMRQDFTVFSMPSIAELWIASHLHFHLYVNGRLACAGPIPNPGAGSAAYALNIDVTSFLEVGTNHIAIIAHDQTLPLAGARHSARGVWLQLNIDGKPAAWTDEKWLCTQESGYVDTGLLTAPCQLFTETLDLRQSYRPWIAEEIKTLSGRTRNSEAIWTAPDIVYLPSANEGALLPLIQLPRLPDSVPAQNVRNIGTFSRACGLTWFSFNEAMDKRGKAGIYAATTYLYATQDSDAFAYCICDIPYILYVNEARVASQAVPSLPVRRPLVGQERLTLLPYEVSSPEMQMPLRSGWNRILIVAECHRPTSGGVLILPEISSDDFKIYQKPDFKADQGWNVIGPFSTPMNILYPQVNFDSFPHIPFVPETGNVHDISAAYVGCDFRNLATEASLDFPVRLDNHGYATIDFGKTRYAFPRITIRGSYGDIIDIVCGEHLDNGMVTPYQAQDNRRNTTTIILREGENQWLSYVPIGMRYMMVVVRKAKSQVHLLSSSVWQESILQDTQGQFRCSDSKLNAIWEAGVKTLSTTVLRIFLDSPTKDCAQTIPDYFIKARASFYTHCAYSISRQALRSFSRSQFETGEMNALSPSGLFQVLPDYSLCWPSWLASHYLHTGDSEFLTKMLPHVEHLLTHYNTIATEPDGPLGDLTPFHGVQCFLDHGDIDRQGIVTGLNAIYCRALLDAAWLAAQNSQQELAQTFRARAGSVASRVWALTWNPEKKMFADSFHDDAPSSQYSWQTSVLAIYGGIAHPEHYEEIWNALFLDQPPFEKYSPGAFNNPYFKYFVLETAFAIGKRQWGIDMLQHYWGSMLNAGAVTWWEMFDPENPEAAQEVCSHCQGYAVSPNIFLVTELLGIRPAEPGMDMVYFNPMPGHVTWAKGSIPTPHGTIQVSWKIREDNVFEVSISANYPVSVVPVLSPEVAETAVFSVSDKVTILGQE